MALVAPCGLALTAQLNKCKLRVGPDTNARSLALALDGYNTS
jgi:hypothetical protein